MARWRTVSGVMVASVMVLGGCKRSQGPTGAECRELTALQRALGRVLLAAPEGLRGDAPDPQLARERLSDADRQGLARGLALGFERKGRLAHAAPLELVRGLREEWSRTLSGAAREALAADDALLESALLDGVSRSCPPGSLEPGEDQEARDHCMAQYLKLAEAGERCPGAALARAR